jgi:hypothetical protein
MFLKVKVNLLWFSDNPYAINGYGGNVETAPRIFNFDTRFFTYRTFQLLKTAP